MRRLPLATALPAINGCAVLAGEASTPASLGVAAATGRAPHEDAPGCRGPREGIDAAVLPRPLLPGKLWLFELSYAPAALRRGTGQCTPDARG